MVRDITMRLQPHVAGDSAALKKHICQTEGLQPQRLQGVRILRRSIDARQRTVMVNLTVRLWVDEEMTEAVYQPIDYPNVEGKPQAVVVGAGPGGLFAALRLIEHGLRPIVVERGKDVHQRKKDLAAISRTQRVDAQSNYCFGEGGAGAYSDGKLYTRSKKRGSIDKILSVFCQHGASTDILVDAHPHIGTDRLPQVIENMRNTILRCGGEVHFQTLMTSFILRDDDHVEGVRGIHLPTGEEKEFRGPVILATGHSARDVYRYLAASHIEIEAKGIAVGVRLEHPAHLIDQIQYHSPQGRGRWLPAAEYSFVNQVDGRGVYSFCMCPGGFVIPAATNERQLVVNGMSPASRGTRWSNSGMVVEVRPEDIQRNAECRIAKQSRAKGESEAAMQNAECRVQRNDNPALAVMAFQEQLEELCWQEGNQKQTAPAQRMVDFVEGRRSHSLPESSYAPGLVSSRLDQWMPSFIGRRLQQGFRKMGQASRGFLTNEACLIAIETRTSSPVRISRCPDTLQHVRLQGLYPCGEGAGYAGGIVSAAIDGERCADALWEVIGNKY